MYIPKEDSDIPLIIIDDFLPKSFAQNLLTEIITLKEHFGKSHWSSGEQRGINPNCTGEDLWLPFSEEEDEKNLLLEGGKLVEIWKYFFHQGIANFLDHSKHPQFYLYSKFNYNFAYHIINYPNGGFYNWHVDSEVSGQTWFGFPVEKPATYTFALTLIKDDSNIIDGGRQLFMKKGKIVELQSKNNQLVIFPSDVYHSLTEITYLDESWESRRFNLQAWLCHI